MASFYLTVITIILAPLYIVRGYFALPFGNFSAIPTTSLEVLILLTAFFTFIDFMKNRKAVSILKTKFDFLIILFLVSAGVALLTSYNFYGGLGILRAYIIEPIIFYYCLIYQSKKYGSNFAIYSLIIGGVWLGALSLIQKLTGSYSLAPHEISQGRISGVYNSANALALYLAPVIILSFSKILTTKNSKKIIFSGVTIFLTIILFWTRSRGGELGLITAFLIFGYLVAVYRYKQVKKYWFILPGILVSLMLFLTVYFYNTYQFLPPSSGKSYSGGDTVQIRYFIWAGTINMLREHLIFGAGLNGFKTLYTNQYRLPEFQEEFQYPHNLFLTFWAEMGIFGLFSFLLLIVSSLVLIAKQLTSSQNEYLGMGLLSIIIYWLVHGLVDVPYFKNDLSLQFWVILALIQIWSEARAYK